MTMDSFRLPALAAIAIICCSDAKLTYFTSDQVDEFIENQQNQSSPDCVQAFSALSAAYNRTQDDEKRQLFVHSFAVGPTDQYSTRDHRYWIHTALHCVNSVPRNQEKKIQDFCWAATSEEVTASVCVPRNCQNERNHLVRTLPSFQDSNNSESRITTELTCVASKWDKPWYLKTTSIIDLTIQACLATLLVSSTIYEHRRQKSTFPSKAYKKFLLCFSLQTNIKRLFQLPSDPKSTITCVVGLRVLSTVWTLVGHSYMVVQVFISNSGQFESDLRDQFFSQIITNFTLCVDTFFVISASLTAYSWFRRVQRSSPENEPSWTSWSYWLRFYRHRVIRLWPACAMTVWIVAGRWMFTHHHPTWPLSDPSIRCRRHWWENLLFLNSLLPNVCLPWLWYLGTEFIFYLLSPIFLLSLRSSARFGFSLIISVIVLSAALRALLTHQYNFPPTQFLWTQPSIFNPDIWAHHTVVYIKPYTRIGSYLVGILLGYALCHTKHLQTKALSARKQAAGWTFSVAAISWSLFGLYPALQGWPWHGYHLFYAAVHRTVFALGVSWLIFACHMGHGLGLNLALSARGLVPLANLSYGAYLFHMVPITASYLWLPFPITWKSHWPILACVLGQTLICYVSGSILACAVEMPSVNMEKSFCCRKQNPKLWKWIN